MKRRDFIIGTSLLAAGCRRDLNAEVKEIALDDVPDYADSGAKLVSDSTPAADGFYFPAEWEEHERTIMVLPPPQNWKGYGIPLDEVRGQWADVANKLVEYEPVLMVVRKEDRQIAKKLLSNKIEVVEFSVNDGWSRDSGPMVLVNGKGERRVAGFTFNGWGAKFPPYADDAQLKARLCKHLNMPMYPIDLVLEGGAVTVDGEGTCITTEQCLLNTNRNKTTSREAIEKKLNASLGTKKVIWLGKGLEPDPVTDGHIDGIAAFANPGTVLLHTTSDRGDPNFKICQDAKSRLQNSTDSKGRAFEVIEVPLDGDVSYINFYIANDCVLVPITGHSKQDDRPMGILREVFDEYDVIGIDSSILGEGGGGIHCITQQVPKATY
jgi:agmatine deiminase